jgi:hypothetical protein
MLEFSGEDDPGHEDLWRDVRGSVEAGRLAVDGDGPGAIGLVVHVTRSTGTPGDPPEGGWFERHANARVPATFPIGLASDASDPDIEGFRNRLLGRSEPKDAMPAAASMIEIIEVWSGEPLKSIQGQPAVVLAPTDAYFLYWIAGLASDSPPRFELWVTPKGAWTPPPSCPEYAVLLKGSSVVAIGPPPDAKGWMLWWAVRQACGMLAGVPDGSTIDLAMAPRLETNEDANPAVGRALYSGAVSGGAWQIAEASPAVTREALEDALALVRDLVTKERLRVRGDAERQAFDAAAATFSPEADSLVWENDHVRLAEADERTLLLLATPVFRVRYGQQWAVDPLDA